jgi:CRP/FNR family transcriptional regulator, cyclic AMP receptor protein
MGPVPAPAAPDTVAPLLQRGRWFASLPPARQAQLLQPAQRVQLAAGQTLFLRGDANAGLYAVLSDSVRIGAVDAAGRDVTLGLLQPPQWFGEIAFFDGGPRTHDASAREPSTLLCVPRSALLALLEQQPVWWQHLGQLMAEKVRALFLGLEDLAALPALPRVVRRLLAMAEGHGMLAEGVAHRSVAVNQEQLGAMLSLTRQTVSEVLRELESRGLVRRQYGAIDLLDPAALARLGG